MDKMYTSTPLSKNYKHGTSNDSNASPKRKRLSNIINQSATPQPEADDDLERTMRRDQAKIQKRLSFIPSPKPQMLSEKEIRDHFQICIKMFSQNKINIKNAWDLNIIDYMRPILYTSEGLNKNSLQMAGTSLDVSAKIYSLRVDDIHTRMLKIASVMARTGAIEQTENTVQDDDNSTEDVNNEGKKRKKNRNRRSVLSGQKTTLAKDPNSLFSDVPKLESVFFQTNINLEASLVDNLFTIKIPMNHSKYKFMFKNKESAWPSYDKVDRNINFNIRYPLKIHEIKDLQICAPFNDFKIEEWDPEQESNLPKDKSHVLLEENEEIVYDEHGFPLPDLDGPVEDVFENENIQQRSPEVNKEVNDVVLTKIVNFNPKVHNLQADEYGYGNIVAGNKLISQVWAGPSHWKFKQIQPTASRFSGEIEKQTNVKKKNNKIQPPLIDFETEEPPFHKTEMYKPRKVKIDLSPRKCTLPQVTRGWEKEMMLRPLMLRKGHIKLDRNNGNEGGDLECDECNCENPNDNLYCSQNNTICFEENDSGDNGDHHQNERELSVHQQRFCNEDLVAMPESVPKSCITYSTRPKVMNMKKLKKAIWKTLVTEDRDENVPNEGLYQREIKEKTFSEVLQEVPSHVSKEMQQELSVPLQFVALLHLCNEQSLELDQQADLGDFIIKQNKQAEL